MMSRKDYRKKPTKKEREYIKEQMAILRPIPYMDKEPMPFGKWKGIPLIEVSASYLLWLYTSLKEDGCDTLEKKRLKMYIENNMQLLKQETKRRERA